MAFGPDGRFAALAPVSRLVRSLTVRDQRVTFDYAVDRMGVVRIARARCTIDGESRQVVRYEYDDDGRLARVRRQHRLAENPDDSAVAMGRRTAAAPR